MTKSDKAFCKALKKAISEAVTPLRVNKEGVSTENLHIVDYEGKSLKNCSADDKRYIYKMVPMEELAEVGNFTEDALVCDGFITAQDDDIGCDAHSLKLFHGVLGGL